MPTAPAPALRRPKRHRDKAVPSQAQPREIELKLELASGAIAPLLAHPALAQARPLPDQSGRLRAVYYDTEDRALRRAGISLRIRSRNGCAIQTLKAEHGARGLAMNRGEWETPVGDALDFAAIADTPLGSLLPDQEARQAVKPLFTIETQRDAFALEHDGAVIEIAVDRAVASAGGRFLPFSEIELELKQGEPAALFGLARALGEAAPLRLGLMTKSERGYTLLESRSVRPFKAETIELPQDASCAEAFLIIARSCLSQMARNEALFRQTQDPAALHQMRVGLRRLRAAMSLFKKHMPDDRETTRIRKDLRRASRPLGQARDLDVLLERLRGGGAAGYGPSDLERVERRRQQAYGHLLDVLETPRFATMPLRIAAWIETAAWSAGDKGRRKKDLEHSARDFAAAELARRWQRIRKSARQLREADDAARHALRIRIKKLRYGTEFLGSLFASGKARRRRETLLGITKDLQDLLGELHDLAVQDSLVPFLPALSPKRRERRAGKLLHRAEAAAARLDRTKPFWI